jgi:excisionase family DNA binding protein
VTEMDNLGCPTLLTLAQAAEKLGVCERTVREHVKARRLRFINLGRGSKRVCMRFDPADLAAFVDAMRQTMPGPAPIMRRLRSNGTGSSGDILGFKARMELCDAMHRKR